jgi:hypothetical protein
MQIILQNADRGVFQEIKGVIPKFYINLRVFTLRVKCNVLIKKIKVMTKKIFLFLCLSIMTSALFAQNGTITVSSNNNQKFWLFIDDVLQNEYSTNIIKLQGLQLIHYKIRVEMDNPSYNCVGETVQILGNPKNNNYVVSLERGNYYSFKKTQTIYTPYFIQNIILADYNYYSSYNQFLYPGFNPNANYGQGNQFRGSAYKGYQHNNQGYGNPSGHGNPPSPSLPNPHQLGCMNPNDFSKAISVIQQEKFESSKISVAKQMTSNNPLCVSQIIQICRLFSFEDNKLDFAKFAYRSCVDRNNYYQVNEVFTYSSSKDELRKYIGN